jgi:PAS domain S-box-containing protein
LDTTHGGAKTGKEPKGSDQGIEHLLLDVVQAAVIATDSGGNVLHWNRHAEEMFGYTRSEAVGRNLLELIVHPMERGAVRGIVESLETGETWTGEFEAITKSGLPIWTRIRVSPTRDERGVLMGLAGFLVDITDLKRGERRLEAQYSVTRVLAEAETLDEATPRILAAVGESLDLPMGAIWEVDRSGNLLRCVATWNAPGAKAEEFDALTRNTAFPPGVGLPGRVWATGSSAWIRDVVADDNFPRAPVAAQEGLRGAFAFPIVLGREILGVIEFFSSEIREPDPDLLAMMGSVGSQIGQFIERKEAEEAVRESESRKSAIVEGSLDCIVTMDHEGRVVEFNPAAEQTFGYSRDEVLGKELAELIIPPDFRARHRRGLATYLATGEGRFLRRRMELTGARSDGTQFPVELAITVIPNEIGPPMFTGFLRDITDRKRGEEARGRLLAVEQAAREESERGRERSAFLAEASTLLSGSLDYRKTLNKVVRLSVPRLADWCSVDALEEGEIRPLAVAHVDPDMIDKARELRRRWPPDMRAERGATAVIRTGSPELYTEVPDSLLQAVAQSDEHLQMLRSLGFRSAMVVPLTARGRTFGAITFVSTGSDRRYGPEDLALAEELASRAAQAVDNARLYQERSHIARALQQSLLPQRLPDIGWCEVAARYRAAGEGEVGGDFYDVFETSEGAWFAAIGDVQGKGPEAAAITGLARYTIKAASTSERNPSRILRTLNQTMLREGTDRFMTVALCRLQLMNGTAQVAISCGGHPLPYVVRQSGEVETADCLGNLLGVFPEPDLQDYMAELSPGDALVFYTDGVVEEPAGGRVFGEGRLEALLKEATGLDAETVAGRVEQAVLEFRDEELRDDMAILVVRFRPDRVAREAQDV